MSTEDELKLAEKVQKELLKRHNNVPIIYDAQKLLDKKRKIVSVSPSLDIALGGGILEGTWTILSGPPKCGKMQPLDSLVYTPEGPRTMREIKVGDTVLTVNGTTTVEATFDNGVQDIYAVEFENGDVVECGLPHLWEVKSRYSKSPKVVELQEIMNDLYETDGRPKWQIVTTVAEFKEQPITIHPYVLGALLGDGCISGRDIKFTSTDDEIIQRINSLLDYGYFLKRIGDTIDFRINSSKKLNQLRIDLENLRLMGLNSHTKFIPENYIFNTKEVRLELIRGLLDTDGSVSKRGHIEFTTTSKAMAYQVKDIIQSLGGIATIKERMTYCNGKEFSSYRIHIRYNNTQELVTLQRKKARCKNRVKKPLTRKIKKVSFVRKAEAKCIKVADNRGLYLTDEFIVTHNTISALQIAANAQKLGKFVYFFAIESRIKPRDLKGIQGFDINMCKIIQSEPECILTAEDFLNDAMYAIKTHPGCVVILDSASALCSSGEFSKDISASGRADGPKLLASFCRQMAGIVPAQNSIVIIIQHLIANTSGYGPTYVEDGGRKITYQFDTKIRCKGVQKWLEGEKKQIGNILTWEIVGSPLGPPGGTTESYLIFGKGIDSEMELVVVSADLGLISKAGAWYTLDFILDNPELTKEVCVPSENPEELRKQLKFQGQEKVKLFLKEHENVKKYLFERIKELS